MEVSNKFHLKEPVNQGFPDGILLSMAGEQRPKGSIRRIKIGGAIGDVPLQTLLIRDFSGEPAIFEARKLEIVVSLSGEICANPQTIQAIQELALEVRGGRY